MSQFIDSIKSVSKNYTKYDDWEQTQADERAKKEYLSKTLPLPKDKVELSSKKANIVIRATEILDRYSEDNCEDMEQLTGLISVIPITIAATLGQGISYLFQEKKDRELSDKIYALKEELQPPIIDKKGQEYVDKVAQLNLLEKKLKNVRTKYPYYGLIFNALIAIATASSMILWGNSKQKEASRIGRYQARQNDLKDIKNFVLYTSEQEKIAEEKSKTIPETKEKNRLVKMIKDLRAIRKDKAAYKKWRDSRDTDAVEKLQNRKLTKEQLDAANNDRELIVDSVKEINIQAEEYSENMENAFDTLGLLSWLIATPLGFGINSLLKLFKVSGKTRAAISVGIPFMTSLGISVSGTMAQKEAAKIGRYKARKDLTSNPARLMPYSDEDMKKAANIKAESQKLSLKDKVLKSFKFFVQFYKDNKEYKEYRKSIHSKQERMQKAYNEINITDEQRKNAENLQKKVFLAFDEIDEMSQRYSEDVEAGTEIAKNILGQFISVGASVSMGVFTFALLKGNVPITKIAHKITDMSFKNDSSLKKAIDDFYEKIKADKKLTKEFQKSMLDNTLKDFMLQASNRDLLHSFNVLKRELKTVFKGMDETNISQYKNCLDPHIKDNLIAKWAKNIIMESSEIYNRSNSKRELGKSSDYTTLIGTGIALALPILAVIIGVPYAFNSWLTDIQKKSGKIGIMKAMEKIDNPAVFAD